MLNVENTSYIGVFWSGATQNGNSHFGTSSLVELPLRVTRHLSLLGGGHSTPPLSSVEISMFVLYFFSSQIFWLVTRCDEKILKETHRIKALKDYAKNISK